jgi:ribonuclease J
MSVTITVYGGAGGDSDTGEVGGNRILLEWDGGGWLCDFGLRFKVSGRFFEEFLKPRSAVGLRDYLRMDMIPPLEGLYRADLSAHDPEVWDRYRDHPAYRRVENVDGVLISHGHLDHNGAVGFLRHDIPLYSGLTTAIIAKAMQDIRPSTIDGEFCYITPREDDGGVLKSVRGQRIQRPYIVCEDVALTSELAEFWCKPPGSRTNLDACPLETWDTQQDRHLRFWRTDHSIPGAGAFGIETPIGWIIYMGDLRRHGHSGGRIQQFIDEAKALTPALLIAEGTRVRETASIAESEVQHAVDEVVANSDGLVIADFGPRNIERLRTFHDVAGAHSRRLAVTVEDAYLLEQLHRVDPAIPAPSDESICVLQEPMATEKVWMRELSQRLPQSGLVDASEVRRDPGAFLLCLSFWDIGNLVDIDPAGGTYIYSASEAYTEEQAIDQQRLINWLEHFGMRRFGGLPGEATGPFHASGHADGPTLESVISEIAPRRILPVHTEDASWFADRWPSEVLSALYGVPIRLD